MNPQPFGLNPNSSLDEPAMRNQGRVLTRHVGLKPDLRSNELSGLKITLCIPTLNPGIFAGRMVASLACQTLQPDEILVIDSASTDGSINAFKKSGATIISINRADFDHGGTRNLAFEKSPADVYIFLTQDAIPADANAIEKLVLTLTENTSYALVYGRHAPSPGAGAFARHERLYHYPAGDGAVVLKSREDIPRLGIKTAFCSNSFAAYRHSAIREIGYFPVNTLFAEDSLAAARLLQRGWAVGYVPQAVVIHSHDNTLAQDFRRFFDTGAFHGMNRWYMDFLGKAEEEGIRFVRAEYGYLKRDGVTLPLLKVVFRNGVRWLGYKAGRLYKFLPFAMRRRFSTNKAFWKNANL